MHWGIAALGDHIGRSNADRIIVYMYFFDTKKHNKPHVHAEFAENSVVVKN